MEIAREKQVRPPPAYSFHCFCTHGARRSSGQNSPCVAREPSQQVDQSTQDTKRAQGRKDAQARKGSQSTEAYQKPILDESWFDESSLLEASSQLAKCCSRFVSVGVNLAQRSRWLEERNTRLCPDRRGELLVRNYCESQRPDIGRGFTAEREKGVG